MTIEEILRLYPSLVIISDNDYSNIIKNLCNVEFDSSKTWMEMGLDDLDIIEMIMTLEKKFDFQIQDYHIDEIFNLNHKPIDFRQYNRNSKIDKIVNDN